MNAELLLAHFDRIAGAPDAVPRLRRFVLDLSVRGKLVEQEAGDEPAARLFERIQAAKVASERIGRARKKEASSGLEQDEFPFPIPLGWQWFRIRQITASRGMKTPDSDFTYIDVTSIDKEVGCIAGAKILAAADAPSRARKVVEQGDVLYSCVRPYLLNVAVVESEITPSPIASTAFAVLNGFGLVIPRFLWIVLRSPFLVACVEDKMRGQAYPAINDSDFAELPFPLPPLAEQHRIVAKVDELMGLCDRLETAQRERESRRDRLAASTHHHLNNGADPEALRTHASFFVNHLPRLSTRPDQIKHLRQTILNLAVVGKLDTHHVEDMPVSELLRRKATLPAGYTRRRKIVKETSIAAQDDCFPRLPASWQYKTVQALYDLNVIVDYADGNHGALYPRASEFGDTGVLFVTAKDLCGGKVTWEGCARLNEARAMALHKGWAQGGDVLLTHNATVGRVARVEPEVEKFLLGTSVTFYRVNNDVLNANYLFHFLQSHTWQGQLQAIMQQTTRNQVSIQKQAFFLVAVPPLAEQQRIVAKVDELMALCDQLEASLITAQIESSRLLESVLHHALQNPALA